MYFRTRSGCGSGAAGSSISDLRDISHSMLLVITATSAADPGLAGARCRLPTFGSVDRTAQAVRRHRLRVPNQRAGLVHLSPDVAHHGAAQAVAVQVIDD